MATVTVEDIEQAPAEVPAAEALEQEATEPPEAEPEKETSKKKTEKKPAVEEKTKKKNVAVEEKTKKKTEKKPAVEEPVPKKRGRPPGAKARPKEEAVSVVAPPTDEQLRDYIAPLLQAYAAHAQLRSREAKRAHYREIFSRAF